MNSPVPGVRATAQPTGIIDTIQSGFDLVNRNLWLLLIPLAVDLIIWLGPQLTIGSLLQQMLADARDVAIPASPAAGQVEEQTQALIGAIRQSEGLSRFNLLSLLAVPLVGVPSFASEGAGRGPAMALASAGPAAGAAVLFIALGLALATVFYGLIGQIIREGRASFREFLTGFWPILAQVICLFAIIVALFAVFGLPAGMAALLPDSPTFPVKSIVGSLLLGISIWLFLYFSFAPDAIYVSRLRSIDAMKASWSVVRHNFWSAVGLIGLMSIIGGGLSIVWTAIAKMLPEPGVLLSICGHIYISAGLAAASMSYYRERFDRLLQNQTVPNQE